MNAQPPVTPEALERQIWQLMKTGRLEQAAAACDQLNQAFPEYGSGWNTSSRLAIALNEPVIALQAVQRALLLSPGKPEWLLQKMASLAVYGDLEAANVIADELAGHEFASGYHASTCAVTLNQLGRYADAERHFARAVELNPNNPNYRFSLASAQRYQGKMEAAARSIDKAVELNPLDCEAQLMRSSFRQCTDDDNHVASILAVMDKLDDDHPGRVQLHYALFKEFDDLGRYDDAFAQLQKGARLRRSALAYDPGAELDSMRLLEAQFDASMFANSVQGHITAEPIFIIGMPRAGTALAENILANHPVVRTTGESRHFGVELFNQCERVLGAAPANTDDLLVAAKQIDFAALGEAYCKQARPVGGEFAHFVDRQPVNFKYAGLIHLALPKAKIIVVEREPVENCFVALRTLFPGAYPYTYDLQELGEYFLAYRRLLAHWRALLPDRIHTVHYEDLVQDSKAAIERVLGACDLSYDSACLNFYTRSDTSETADPVQLRQGLRERTLGQWQHYRAHLGPLIEILEKGGVPVPD